MNLTDRTVIVTGAAHGLGREYAATLAVRGANVVVADLDGASAAVVADKLNAELGADRCVACWVDTTDEDSTRAMAATALDAFGNIDVLVNNVGLYPHTDFDDITLDLWRKVISVNLDSPFLCAKAVVPTMRAAGYGKIVNVATNLVFMGLPEMTHYVAAKAGVVGFTRALARALGPDGISVNAIAPGATAADPTVLDTVGIARLQAIVGYQCLQWAERAEDLSGVVAFLASGDSDFISGQVLTVDGGLTMH
jgi:3-oxoacyl-[acyl-carrier protein] reductase